MEFLKKLRKSKEYAAKHRAVVVELEPSDLTSSTPEFEEYFNELKSSTDKGSGFSYE